MDDTAVLQAFKEHCSPAQFLFCNKWYQDQQIVHYLSKWLPDLHATQLNHALARNRILKLCFENTMYNEHGFYKHRVQIKKKRYVFYFIRKDKAPKFYSAAQKWLQEAEGNQIRKTSNRQKQRQMLSPVAENANNTAAKHARTHGAPPAFKTGMNSATQLDQPLPFGFSGDTVEPMQSPEGVPPIKQLDMPNDNECLPCPDDSGNCNGQFANRTSPLSSIATATTADTTSPGSNETSFATTQTLPCGFTTGEASQALLEEMQSTFFDQPRVCCLFGGKCDSPGSTRSNLVRWIKKLEEATFELTGFQYIVNKLDSTPLSHDQSQRILLKARYLLLSYRQALAHMLCGMSWYDCIEAATKGVVGMFGEKAWRCNRTIGRWNIAFWQTEKFLHLSILVELGKQSMPAIFDQMPKAKKVLKAGPMKV